MSRPKPDTAVPEDPAWKSLRLDELTLTRKEGFAAFAEAPDYPRPPDMTMVELKALGPAAKEEHDLARRRFLANLRPIKTVQADGLIADLTDVLEAGLDQPNWEAKGMAAVDAFPGLGKTTVGLSFAKRVHNDLIRQHGRFTAAGHERWPVIRVGMMGDTTVKDFNWAMLEFFAHSGRNSGTANSFLSRALDCAVSCESRLLLVDDLQFLRFRSIRGTELANQFKTIANEFPLMILFIGYDLRKKGLYEDPQLERRITPLELAPFTIKNEAGRMQWRSFLLSLEQRVVLADKYPGMLADDLSDHLYARCSGHIGSLMTLVKRACLRAIRTGEERLTPDLLTHVKPDRAAREQQAQWEELLASGMKTSRPRNHRKQG
ncbi:ATP-binding protein [Actinocrinis puniceicyclus]|uniref:ATP-binding protein n=1 Tax=Actinocrinis puniceicyclus TaxID=977794 RepID=A0A8J8BD14_9ACTN|nr:ATP-binding protein [Actinocrinis puniceicyclus]MBS2964778.1 ATP-binding protein [Actinocrinis puniceicyclus]